MVIRKGFTKSLSLESGINLLNRKYEVTISDSKNDFSGTSNFEIRNYEIPTSLLVYVKLGDQLFMNVSGGFSIDMYPNPLFSNGSYYENSISRYNWIRTSLIANIGWEYRTLKNGYFYLGFSLHRPFDNIMREDLLYTGFGKQDLATFDLSGNYLTLDLRYFFHEDKQKKKKKKEKKKEYDYRIKKPKHLKKKKK